MLAHAAAVLVRRLVPFTSWMRLPRSNISFELHHFPYAVKACSAFMSIRNALRSILEKSCKMLSYCVDFLYRPLFQIFCQLAGKLLQYRFAVPRSKAAILFMLHDHVVDLPVYLYHCEINCAACLPPYLFFHPLRYFLRLFLPRCIRSQEF